MFTAVTILNAQEITKKTYYQNGKLKSKIAYSDSVRDGEANFYYSNGNLQEVRTYVNGRVEGTVKTHYKNGKVKEIFTITDGRRDGPTSFFDSTGTYLKDIVYTDGKMNIVEPITVHEENGDSLFAAKIEKLKRSSTKAAVPPNFSNEHFKNDPVYFTKPDVPAKPMGGMASIYKKLVYPDSARENNIQGIVDVITFIDEKGNVVSTKIDTGLGYGCDEAAESAIKYTKFKPAKFKGDSVKSQLKISLEFKSYGN
jgi:TonB family protein